MRLAYPLRFGREVEERRYVFVAQRVHACILQSRHDSQPLISFSFQLISPYLIKPSGATECAKEFKPCSLNGHVFEQGMTVSVHVQELPTVGPKVNQNVKLPPRLPTVWNAG